MIYTLKELADKVGMSSAELLDWFPGMLDPLTADNECLDETLSEDILKVLGPLDTHPY